MSRYKEMIKFEKEINHLLDCFCWDDAWDELYRNDNIEPLKKSVEELENIILRMKEKIKEIDS